MFCKHCGAKIDDDAAFCTNCGKPIVKENAVVDTELFKDINTKYCTNCGAQMPEEAVVCIHCGNRDDKPADASALSIVAKVFLIIGCVVSGFYLLPLCWTIPMTVHYCRCIKERKPLGVGFKVCSLLFVSTVAGILMLCDTKTTK